MPEEEDPYLSLIGEYLCRTARAKSLQCLVESGIITTLTDKYTHATSC